MAKVQNQIIAVLSCMFASMSAGYVLGWQSLATLKLKEPGSEISITNSQAAWMATAVCIGGVLGAPIFAVIANRMGRKWITFIASSSYLIGWIFALLATNIWHLYVARAFHGLGIAFTLCIVPVYVGEIVEDTIRGAITGVVSTMFSLGALTVYAIGPEVSFDLLNLISLLFPVLALLAFLAMPESPHFLVMDKRLQEAERNLVRVRGEEEDKRKIAEELENICKFVEDCEDCANKEKRFFKKKFVVSFVLVTALVIAQQFSGFMAFKSFFHIMFDQVDSPLETNIAVVIAEVIAVLFGLLACFFFDSLGRRPFFFISAFGTIVANLLIGTYYYLEVDNEYSWIATIGLYTFQIFYYSGMNAVPLVIASEIFPAHYRTSISAFMITMIFIVAFAATKLYQIVGDSYGYYCSYYMFAVMTAIPTVYLFFALPETKQVPLVEIQQEITLSRVSVAKRPSKMPFSVIS